MLDNYERSLPKRIIIFCSHNYWKLFGLSILLVLIISFHKIFPIVTNPVIVKGVTAEEVVSHVYDYTENTSHRLTSRKIMARIIDFDYEGKHYRIKGGDDEVIGSGIPTKVIFNKVKPQAAVEYSFEGFFDFDFFKPVFKLWFLLSAILYGIVALDKHFSIFEFNVTRLSPLGAVIIAILLLLIPIIPNAKLLFYGAKIEGILVNDDVFYRPGKPRYNGAYHIKGIEYKIPINDLNYDDPLKVGLPVPVIYDPYDPENSALNTFNELYVTGWLALTGIGLVFLAGWYASTRMPNDEGTMDE